MRNHFWTIGLLLLLPSMARSQQGVPDSLRQVLQNATSDSLRYHVCRLLYTYYEENNRDSALYYANQRALFAQKSNKKIVEASALGVKAYQLIYLGRYGEALESLLQGFKIADDPKNDEPDSWELSSYPSPGQGRLLTLSLLHHMFGHLLLQTQNVTQQYVQFKEGRRIAMQIDNKFRIMIADMVLGTCYMEQNQPDSAFFYAKEGEQIALEAGIKRYNGNLMYVLGDVYMTRGDSVKAYQYYQKGLRESLEQNNWNTAAVNYYRLISYYRKTGRYDSVLYCSLKYLDAIKVLGNVTAASTLELNIGTAYEKLYQAYQLLGRTDSAFKYQGLALAAKDSITQLKIKNLASFQHLSLNEQMRMQDEEKQKAVEQNRIRTYTLLGAVVVCVLIAFLLYRNNRNRRKANEVLEQQKKELQLTLSELKSTQAQLIQSEKMASLGELTAGIAHEIQNPLNFVNNFSEVNTELIDEMNQELEAGKTQAAVELAKDIRENNNKINQHGQRADSIVKGMLQHSRSSGGQKEATDINALADEYLRLAYHGLRAKDKSFNATLKTDYDASIGNVNIIPQDIGRVLMNLYSNAFYAVQERKRLVPQGYEPVVLIRTKKRGDKIEILVKDNGNGIPKSILEKIFQPFFTTKPTGQGTGLGLSLAYDIVKAHGGELKVETKDGEGAEFVVQLGR